ncbi:hydantoinase/carbamoylase family amidase [Orrella marina]|uniref:Zn-dependent hydrolase n=1 Tax=Orrella marina TaxID=2163011 RepID=A0A2R4XK61_9BURK|nr:hydantoinase/carbamoylase family amidase [Orrella marina]AWB34225.1 Zn-dependent hydrolase [Orrella marina]
MDQLGIIAQDILEEVRNATRDTLGVSRESFGDGENKALDILQSWARKLELGSYRDPLQNLWIHLKSDPLTDASIVIGSHADSVPQGGNYDGLAGIVAGILALLQLRESGQILATPVRVLALRGEESAWYGKAYMGSLALFGKLPVSELENRHRTEPKTLRQAMQACGSDVSLIEQGKAVIRPDEIAAYLELHIEQGPVMVAREWPVAAVTGIRGNIRHNRVLCLGETGHSGAVPRWLRKDSVLAMAELLSRLDEHWRVLLQMGMDLVMTVGICSTRPESHAVSVIPGEVSFSFEVRSQDAQTLKQFYQLMHDECERIEAARGVRFEFDRKIETAPARSDDEWLQRLCQAGSLVLGAPMETIPSGAGHDAAVFANEGVASAMVFIRNANGSHNPYEEMDLQDFLLGTRVLTQAILQSST